LRTHARTRSHAPQPPRETPLKWLARRKDKAGRPLLTTVQVEAGEKLAQDYWHARLQPRTTSDWSGTAPSARTRRSAPGAGVELRDAVLAARQRVDRALDAAGPELAGLLVDVCCYDVGLEAAEQARGWQPRSGKVVLDLALTALARHYRLIAPERPISTRLRHWGDADYRPTLNEWR
jgi:hypothetical protein